MMGRDGDIKVKGVELGGLRSGQVSYRRHTERPGGSISGPEKERQLEAFHQRQTLLTSE